MLEAESTPGPYCDRKDYINEKFQWHHLESNQRPPETDNSKRILLGKLAFYRSGEATSQVRERECWFRWSTVLLKKKNLILCHGRDSITRLSIPHPATHLPVGPINRMIGIWDSKTSGELSQFVRWRHEPEARCILFCCPHNSTRSWQTAVIVEGEATCCC